MRSDREHCASRVAVEQEEEERRGGEEQATDIKSNNPHLAGGEKQSPLQSFSLENEIFSDTSPLNLLLVSPKQTPTSLKILCQMAPTKKKCQKGTPPPPGGILSGILSGKSSGIQSGKHSGTASDIPSGILSGISSGILSGISSGILSGISSGILSDMLSGVLPGISSGILSGR